MAICYDKLPENLQCGMKRYIEKGIRPGGFLVAFLSNDLAKAISRADEETAKAFRAIHLFLYNDVPCGCYGSAQHVEDWISHRGLEGGV